MNSYTLFSTTGCHLCEDAESLLLAADLTFGTIDIMDDDLAWQRYSTRIPVLLNPKNDRELNWPFNAEQLQWFISE